MRGYSRRGSGTHCHYFVCFGFYFLYFFCVVVDLCVGVMSVKTRNNKNSVDFCVVVFILFYFILIGMTQLVRVPSILVELW